MKLNKRIKYLHIRIKNGVRQTHTAYRELSESEVKRVPNRYWVDDLPKPMKRIKKERTHNIEDTHYACNEQMERLGADTPCCICFGHKCKQLKAIKKECDACKPREHGIVIVEKVEEGGRCIQCRRIVCSPKPTKFEKIAERIVNLVLIRSKQMNAITNGDVWRADKEKLIEKVIDLLSH